jgi:hypothetical protein
VHSRVLVGVAAWLAGASAATGGSLLAVNALGQGMTPAAGEQLSVAAVNRALAKEAAERTAAVPRRSVAGPASLTAPSSPATRHSAPPPPPGTAGGTVLTSAGGTVVASCAGARAYLVSWSPQQGFGSNDVVRGPATTAQVAFTGGQVTVTMIVSCGTGVPTATSTAVSSWGGAASSRGDDGE